MFKWKLLLLASDDTFFFFSLTPSTDCGPFANYKTAYAVVIELVESWKHEYNWLHTIIKIIASSGFIAGTLIVLL